MAINELQQKLPEDYYANSDKSAIYAYTLAPVIRHEGTRPIINSLLFAYTESNRERSFSNIFAYSVGARSRKYRIRSRH